MIGIVLGEADRRDQGLPEVRLERGNCYPSVGCFVESVARYSATEERTGLGDAEAKTVGKGIDRVRESYLLAIGTLSSLSPQEKCQCSLCSALGASHIGHERSRQNRRLEQTGVRLICKVMARLVGVG
jgi:hypothetical protein